MLEKTLALWWCMLKHERLKYNKSVTKTPKDEKSEIRKRMNEQI